MAIEESSICSLKKLQFFINLRNLMSSQANSALMKSAQPLKCVLYPHKQDKLNPFQGCVSKIIQQENREG